MKIKTGMIFFWRNTDGFFGKGISFYNKREFPKESKDWLPTHVGIVSKVVGDKISIHEAMSNGFIMNTRDLSWIKEKIKEGKCRMGRFDEPLRKVSSTCYKYENIRYGWLDIIGIGMSSLFGWRILGITGKNAIICSEAVSRIAYDCSYRIDFQKEYGIRFDAITPAHIYLSKHVKVYKRSFSSL